MTIKCQQQKLVKTPLSFSQNLSVYLLVSMSEQKSFAQGGQAAKEIEHQLTSSTLQQQQQVSSLVILSTNKTNTLTILTFRDSTPELSCRLSTTRGTTRGHQDLFRHSHQAIKMPHISSHCLLGISSYYYCHSLSPSQHLRRSQGHIRPAAGQGRICQSNFFSG